MVALLKVRTRAENGKTNSLNTTVRVELYKFLTISQLDCFGKKVFSRVIRKKVIRRPSVIFKIFLKHRPFSIQI